MIGISIFVLALAVGQIVGDDQVKTGSLPFWITNPSQVAGGKLYESDMLLTEEQTAALKKRKARPSSQWTNGPDGNPLVPYRFLDAVSQTDVRRGLDHWMEHTCINFEQTTNTDQPHLKFFIGSGCFSYVGMISYKNIINAEGQLIDDENGEYGQQISPCNDISVVVHEIGHAIGFHHEQSRSDRDGYIKVLLDNVLPGDEYNFDKVVDNNYSVPYDYSSNMHYGINFFSIDENTPKKPTMITKDPLVQELIGSRNTLTHRDKLTANRLYNCTGKWLDRCNISSDPCLNDGYTGKDCTCICPGGTIGSNCENVVDDYYATYRSTFSEQIFTEKAITVDTPMEAGERFVKWAIPPTCQKAKITFTSSAMETIDCQAQYLYVKTNFSDEVGQIMCYEDVVVGVTLESDTGIFITMYNYYPYDSQRTLWTADVTFENITGCPSTDPPTESSTEPPTNSPTTPEDTNAACDCKKKLSKAVESITIRNFHSEDSADNCGWDIQAAKEKNLGITCDDKNISAKDDTGSSVRLNIQFYSEF